MYTEEAWSLTEYFYFILCGYYILPQCIGITLHFIPAGTCYNHNLSVGNLGRYLKKPSHVFLIFSSIVWKAKVISYRCASQDRKEKNVRVGILNFKGKSHASVEPRGGEGEGRGMCVPPVNLCVIIPLSDLGVVGHWPYELCRCLTYTQDRDNTVRGYQCAAADWRNTDFFFSLCKETIRYQCIRKRKPLEAY